MNFNKRRVALEWELSFQLSLYISPSFYFFICGKELLNFHLKIKLSSCAKCMEMSTKFMISCIDVPTFR